MNIRDYEYIAALAKYRTISRASKELYISQPALSKFLQKTEQELNVCLFQRVGRQLVPTFAGQQLAAAAADILFRHNQMLQTIGDIAHETNGQIQLGIPMSRGNFFIARILPDFYQQYPKISLSIFEDSTQTLLKKLRLGELDLVFANMPEESSDLYAEEVSEEEMVLAAPKDYHLEEKAVQCAPYRFPGLFPNDWCEYPFLMLSRDQMSRKFAEQYFKQQRFSPNVLLKIRNLSQVLYCVQRGLGVTICPSLPQVTDELSNNVAYFSLLSDHGPAIRKTAILYRKDAYLTKAEHHLISIIHEKHNY